MTSLVLVGPMGVGKTTIGKKLAKAMGLPFLDSDALFVELYGSIPEYFENHGEAKFRDLEESIIAECLSKHAVLATGGGAVLSSRTQQLLENAFVVYLATDGRHMASRLSGGGRPLLKNGLADWRRIYESRKPIYEQVADLVVDTSSATLTSTIQSIREGFESHGNK